MLKILFFISIYLSIPNAFSAMEYQQGKRCTEFLGELSDETTRYNFTRTGPRGSYNVVEVPTYSESGKYVTVYTETGYSEINTQTGYCNSRVKDPKKNRKQKLLEIGLASSTTGAGAGAGAGSATAGAAAFFSAGFGVAFLAAAFLAAGLASSTAGAGAGAGAGAAATVSTTAGAAAFFVVLRAGFSAGAAAGVAATAFGAAAVFFVAITVLLDEIDIAHPAGRRQRSRG